MAAATTVVCQTRFDAAPVGGSGAARSSPYLLPRRRARRGSSPPGPCLRRAAGSGADARRAGPSRAGASGRSISSGAFRRRRFVLPPAEAGASGVVLRGLWPATASAGPGCCPRGATLRKSTCRAAGPASAAAHASSLLASKVPAPPQPAPSAAGPSTMRGPGERARQLRAYPRDRSTAVAPRAYPARSPSRQSRSLAIQRAERGGNGGGGAGRPR